MTRPMLPRRHRIFESIYWAAVAGVFAWAAWKRFLLPVDPVADPDTWGYLLPATKALTGEGFLHSGRNFVYPGFLYVVLAIGRDFRAIGIVQHLMGLMAGGLMLGVWLQVRNLIRERALPDAVYRAFGLIVIGLYLLAGETIRTELQIRPEAICGFLGLLNLWFVLRFTHRFFIQRDERAATRLAIATILSALVFGSVRPSFWFAALSSLLPIGFLLLRSGARARLAVLAGAAAGVVLLVVPERWLARNDDVDAVFLPTLLFAQHADLIRDQMANDLASSSPPYPRDWLTRIHASLVTEIGNSTRSPRPYPSLGFDPEYLMYHPDSINAQLGREFHDDVGALCSFYRSYYFRAFLRQPARMLGKIARQVAIFYRPRCGAYNWSRFIELRDDYVQSIHEVATFRDRFGSYDVAADFVARSESLAKASLRLEERPYIRYPLSALSKRYVLCLVTALAMAALVLTWPALRRRYGWAVAALLFFYWHSFVTCVETGMVNSLEVPRYLMVQLAFVIFAQGLTLTLVLELVAGGWRALLSRQTVRPAHPDLDTG